MAVITVMVLQLSNVNFEQIEPEIRAEVAQLVQRPTQKPSAISMRAQVPGAARDFSLSQVLMQTLSLTVT